MVNPDPSNDPNALLKMWLEYQNGFMKAQDAFFPGYKAADVPAMKKAVDSAFDNWSSWEKQAADWFKTADNWLLNDLKGSGGDTFIAESLKRLLDPKYFSMAALDEVSNSVQRMAEGPEFADMGLFEKRMLQSTAEWLAMREADANYKQITGSAWARAFQKYSTEIAADWSLLSSDPRKGLDRWLEIANDELIQTQRQDDFLEASRKLFRATIEYRLKQREVIEIWCESQSIPTRTEVDDLHRTVTELRRELRAVKRQLVKDSEASDNNPDKARKQVAVKPAASEKKATPAAANKERPRSKKKTVARKATRKKAASKATSTRRGSQPQ